MREDAQRITREITGRAIRRLQVLEVVMFGAAVALALLGGALVAFLVGRVVEAPFRLTWLMTSLLLLAAPAAVVYGRDALASRSPPGRENAQKDEEP